MPGHPQLELFDFDLSTNERARKVTTDQSLTWKKQIRRPLPPISSKMAPIRRKVGEKRNKLGSFWGVVFHENTFSKSKFGSKGAELFWAPPNLTLNCAYVIKKR